MRIRIGPIELLDVTLDDLDSLIKKYYGLDSAVMVRAQVDVEPPILGGVSPGAAMPGPTIDPGVAVIGGKKMTAKEVAELRKRMASPTPLPKIDSD